MTVTGKDLIELGFPQGPALGEALAYVRAQGLAGDALRAFVSRAKPAPYLSLQDAPDFALNLEAEDDAEIQNVANVTATMRDLMRTPPVAADFLPDTAGIQIVPLNMAEPILLIRGVETAGNLGFAPHGAGRNISRSAHKRGLGLHDEAAVFARETNGIDARFFSGNIDVSELPSAYKSAATVRSQMRRFGLAEVVDEIYPYGCIMAGDWERDAPWRMKAAAKYRDRAQPVAAH